jgi:hypothetical protein
LNDKYFLIFNEKLFKSLDLFFTFAPMERTYTSLALSTSRVRQVFFFWHQKRQVFTTLNDLYCFFKKGSFFHEKLPIIFANIRV